MLSSMGIVIVTAGSKSEHKLALKSKSKLRLTTMFPTILDPCQDTEEKVAPPASSHVPLGLFHPFSQSIADKWSLHTVLLPRAQRPGLDTLLNFRSPRIDRFAASKCALGPSV